MPEDVSAPLPDVTLMPGSTVEIDAGAGNTVTNLVIHGFQIVPPPPSRHSPLLLPGLASGLGD